MEKEGIQIYDFIGNEKLNKCNVKKRKFYNEYKEIFLEHSWISILFLSFKIITDILYLIIYYEFIFEIVFLEERLFRGIWGLVINHHKNKLKFIKITFQSDRVWKSKKSYSNIKKKKLKKYEFKRSLKILFWIENY